MTIAIRPERPGEEAIIGELHLAAFGGQRVPALMNALRASDNLLAAFVAELDGEIAGHVCFTRGWLDAPDRLVEVAVLSPLGVLPAYQRRGVGRALVAHGVASLTLPAVFLEGDPGYYSRLGWQPGGPLGFERPSTRIPEAAFQVITLDGYQPWMTGRLVYPEAFWAQDCVGLRRPTPDA